MNTTGQKILRQIDIMDACNGIPHGIVLLDRDFRILGMNRFLEALTGYASGEARGIYYDHIIRISLPLKDALLQSAVIDAVEPLSLEGDIINQARKKLAIRFTIAPLRDIDGAIQAAIITLEDISFLKSLDDKIHGQSFAEIIGHSPQMQKIFELLPVIAQTDATALITGETGSGKDLVAEAIHNSSKRAGQPFVKINCGALPESLLESELFGHSRGAFTGAEIDKPGMFRLAHGGTIFLTEIGDLPLPLQVKLLTVLDDKEFFPLGSSKKVKIDVRVITATHRDLQELVRQGRFREDLFFRLNVLRLHLPPLRERIGDIRLFMDHFLQEFQGRSEKNIKGFDQEVIEIMLRHAWPGNIREIRNTIEYAVTICPGGVIRREHLPGYIFAVDRPENSGGPLPAASVHEVRTGTGTEQSRSWDAETPGTMAWPEMEKKMIMDALVKAGGRRLVAAEILGWARSTLWRKMKSYKLD
ncbi:MAG: sigma-54-dependent Fis family transcriptional regulator [Deltaproteobacteria bacterium RIFOXYD12_FULL_57_12]|nr:MAG: sigma-54-dependent Fis family transcriptional regulator [Deltaproteobacteria bacterium RIFOXYD12_FULL_57_12]